MQKKLPVTVLTGFLGAGKTTLMNRILTEQHGKRIAVIENEFGEIGIDHELVINAEEEIFEMNNGCICCTVRGDLIRILGNLMKRRDKFDHILIETTGMADPGPVVQTFFVDDDVKESLFLNGVVTVVDVRHILEHLDDSNEAQEQIAFGDVILLNKCDLVAPGDVDRLEARIKSMNGVAAVHRTTNAAIEIDKIFNVGGFNLERAIGVDPKFLEPEYPFEWGGIFELPAGVSSLKAEKNPDPSMKLAVLTVADASEESLAQARDKAVRIFSSEEVPERAVGTTLNVDSIQELILQDGQMHWDLPIPASGHYAFFAEHYPEELDLRLEVEAEPKLPLLSAAYKPDHEHDEAVSSVGIEADGDCDGERINDWLQRLLQEQGQDIFRMKGVFAVRGNPDRVIFQGVHMLLDAQAGGPWGDRKRKTSMVCIGRNLDREALNRSFAECLVRL